MIDIDKYIFKDSGGDITHCIDKEDTEHLLYWLEDILEEISQEFKWIDKDVFMFFAVHFFLLLRAKMIYDDVFGTPESFLEFIEFAMDDIEKIKELLWENEKEQIAQDPKTLEDYGYKEDYPRGSYYVKVIEDTHEKEVVDEIVAVDGKRLHRERTVIWEDDDTGRHSKEITYKKLPIDKELNEAIKNTLRNNIC